MTCDLSPLHLSTASVLRWSSGFGEQQEAEQEEVGGGRGGQHLGLLQRGETCSNHTFPHILYGQVDNGTFNRVFPGQDFRIVSAGFEAETSTQNHLPGRPDAALARQTSQAESQTGAHRPVNGNHTRTGFHVDSSSDGPASLSSSSDYLHVAQMTKDLNRFLTSTSVCCLLKSHQLVCVSQCAGAPLGVVTVGVPEVPEVPRLELMEQDSKDSAQSSSTSSSCPVQLEYNVRRVGGGLTCLAGVVLSGR